MSVGQGPGGASSSAELDAAVAALRACFESSHRDERRAAFDAYGVAQGLAGGWAAEATSIAGWPGELHHTASRGAGAEVNLLVLHGGGYSAGSPRSHRGLASRLAAAARLNAFVLQYPLAPERPFPAAVEAASAVAAALCAAAPVVLVGDSAGGGLAMACALRLRDEGRPTPAGLALMSPWLDLTLSTDAASPDPLCSLEGLREDVETYLAGADHREPWASPLFADLAGLPPVFIQSGQVDRLLPDSVRLDAALRAAGGETQLEVWPGMVHSFQMFAPVVLEAHEAVGRLASWIVGALARA